MKKNIQISVPKPCHEKWSSFPKTSNGGFCSSCQKEVIDFTSWSEDRLKLHFKNVSANTCGRFRQEQLKIYAYDKPSTNRFGWLSVSFAGMLVLFTSRQGLAQQANPSKQTTEQYQEDIKSGKTLLTVSDVVKVNGIVKSREDGGALPGVNVVYKGTGKGTVTDADGRFTLTLENLSSSPALVFSFIGMQTVEYTIDVMKPEQEIVVDMFYDNVSLTGEIIVGGAMVGKWYSPRTWWWRIKNLF